LTLLDPANAALLILVVPIAFVGWRWGLRAALGIAAFSSGLVLVPVSVRGHINLVGYLSRATAFATVAVLAGVLHGRSDRPGEPAAAAGGAAGSLRGALPLGARPEDVLSLRELEVLAMIAEGAPNAEIADRLVIAETTVQSHVQNILRKLGARNRTEAAARYLRG
jgi:DNA-binding CsgD family transcriptional regulator